jgi:hypothetical protein
VQQAHSGLVPLPRLRAKIGIGEQPDGTGEMSHGSLDITVDLNPPLVGHAITSTSA